MPFERFTDVGRSYVPRATLSRYGAIAFNHGARRKFGLDQFAFCVLYFDADTREIGIELTNEKDASGAVRLRLRGKTGADVAARSFMDYYGIAATDTIAYPLKRSPDSGFLVIELDSPSARARKRRTRKGRTDSGAADGK
jgi:hypothetical protein